jgi:ABC-type transport system substrate-binding protein
VNRLAPFLRLCAVAALAGVGTATGGCGTNAYPGEPAGTLHVSLVSEIKGLDPIQADEETTSTVVINLYDQLYEYEHLKRPFELRPCLAEAMPEVSADGLTYTIRLRKGIRFNDDPCFSKTGGQGREFVASDVVYSFQRLMDAKLDARGTWIFDGKIVGLDAFHAASGQAKGKPAVEGYPPVEGLSAPDERTVVIKLTEAYPQIMWVLAMSYGSIYPPEAVAYYGDDFKNRAVTTGPYVIEEYKPNQRIVLRRNPAYRTDDRYPSDEGRPGDRAIGRLSEAGKVLPLNERVVATVMKETTPMWLYFMRGYLDRVGVPKDNFASAIDPKTKELIPEMKQRGVTLDKDPRLEVIYDCFNMQDPVVGKGEKARAIRRAMSLAFDYDWAKTNLYNDRVSRVEGPIIEEFDEFDPAFVNPWKPRPGETRAQVLDRARKILADAGMPGGKGIPEIEQDMQDDTTNRQFFQSSQRDFAEIGIKLKPYTSTWSEMDARINKGQVQMFGQSWGADYPDAQNFLQLFYGPNKAPGPNGSAYQNPEFDRLFAQASTMQKSPERRRIYQELQRIVVDDCVWIVKYRRENYNLINPWLHGYRYNDISAKYYKYCRVDTSRRTVDVRGLNEMNLLPGVLLFLGVGLLVGVTLLAGRRRMRGW